MRIAMDIVAAAGWGLLAAELSGAAWAGAFAAAAAGLYLGYAGRGGDGRDGEGGPRGY